MTRAGDLLALFRALPIATQAAWPGRNFAVIAPHPDDESLGCGGVIAQACATGQPPPVIILTDGAGSHPGSVQYTPKRLAALRAQETEAAVTALGLPRHRLHFLDQPDGATPTDHAGVSRLAGRIADIAQGCDALLTTWRHDPHCDHQAARKIAGRAALELGARLLEYPVWGWMLPENTELPEASWRGFRLDISDQRPAKRAAIAAHRSQHGKVITDDPSGFVLPADFLSLFDETWEVFVEADG